MSFPDLTDDDVRAVTHAWRSTAWGHGHDPGRNAAQALHGRLRIRADAQRRIDDLAAQILAATSREQAEQVARRLIGGGA